MLQTGRPALQHIDRYSVRTYEGGRGVTAVLGPDEASASADRPGAPPQIVRDAVKVTFSVLRYHTLWLGAWMWGDVQVTVSRVCLRAALNFSHQTAVDVSCHGACWTLV